MSTEGDGTEDVSSWGDRLIEGIGAVLGGAVMGAIVLGLAGGLIGAVIAKALHQYGAVSFGFGLGGFLGAQCGLAAGTTFALIGGRAGVLAAGIAGGCADPFMWLRSSYTKLDAAQVPVMAAVLLLPFIAALLLGWWMARAKTSLSWVEDLRADSLLPRTPLPLRLLVLTPHAAFVVFVVHSFNVLSQPH